MLSVHALCFLDLISSTCRPQKLTIRRSEAWIIFVKIMRWNIVLGALVASSVVNAAAVSKGSPLVPTTVETPAVAAIEAVVPHGPHQPHLVRKYVRTSSHS